MAFLSTRRVLAWRTCPIGIRCHLYQLLSAPSWNEYQHHHRVSVYETPRMQLLEERDDPTLPSLLACNYYNQSSLSRPSSPRRLQFVHIRKTGGTAIEYVLETAGIGTMDYWKHGQLDRLELQRLNRTMGNRNRVHAPPSPPRYFWPWCRPPPDKKNQNQSAATSSTSSAPPRGRTPRLFAVVRNPYDECYQHFKIIYERSRNRSLNDPALLNDFIPKRISLSPSMSTSLIPSEIK
jgi:hypothetical protein